MSKNWFITGASGGFGREWASAALERGDCVIATARTPSKLDDLAAAHVDRMLVLPLDVNDRSAVIDAVKQGHAHFGRIDVVVANAGYGLFGMVEEVSEAEARAQFETNYFGVLWTVQAVLPYLRAQGSGHILLLSSTGGVNVFPPVAVYNSSKWAVEAIGQGLRQQVSQFGIKVTLIEPTGYDTDFFGGSSKFATRLPAYEPMWEAIMANLGAPDQQGVPSATRGPILEIVDMAEPPLRAFLGAGTLEMMEVEYAARLQEWRDGNERALRAFGR